MPNFAMITAPHVLAAEVKARRLFNLPRTPRPLVNESDGGMYRLSWGNGCVAEVQVVLHAVTTIDAVS